MPTCFWEEGRTLHREEWGWTEESARGSGTWGQDAGASRAKEEGETWLGGQERGAC